MTSGEQGVGTNSASAENDDPVLLAAVREGKPEAFAELYRKYYPAALRTAQRNARQFTDAEDIAADAFAQTFGAIQRGAGPTEAFLPYLLTAVRNAAAQTAKKAQRQIPTDEESELDEQVPAAEHAVLLAAQSTELTDMLATLPPRWQAVLWSIEVEGKTPREVAADWDMSPNSVSALAVRARAGLRVAYLKAQLGNPRPGLPKECQKVQGDLPALVRESLSKGKVKTALTHVSGCSECRAVLEELEEANRQLRALAWPLLLLGLGGASMANFWNRSAGHKVAAVGAGATVAAGGIFGLVHLFSDDEPAPQVGQSVHSTIVDVSEGDGPRRTYEVRFTAPEPGTAHVRLGMPLGTDYLGSYSPDALCLGTEQQVYCDLGVDATGEQAWRFEVVAEETSGDLPTVEVVFGQ